MRLDETVTIAALVQAICAKLYKLRIQNLGFRRYRRALILENKWRASRYGIDGKLIDFAVPLVFSRVAVGSLYLGFSRKPIDDAVATARNSTIVISAAMVIVGILGALGLATVLSGPVMRLVEGTRAVAAGNFQIHLPVTSRDEIGALTESFNQMAKNLREKEMIKRAFTRYVARQVVDEILKDPEQLKKLQSDLGTPEAK